MKALRIVSYAINGRGMGHLVRQLAILRWVRRYAEVLGVRVEPWVLSSSEADTLARREGIAAIKIPSKTMIRDGGLDPASTLGVLRGFVLAAVSTLQPDLMLVDTFPGGTFGELAGVLEIARKRVLVARPVQSWISGEEAYRGLLPLYDRVIVPEFPAFARPPFPRTDAYVGPILIRDRSELLDRATARTRLGLRGKAVYLSLGGGGDPQANRLIPTLTTRLRAAGWEVVVGAGPLYQGPELRGEGIVWMDRYVPLELFLGLDAAVSAGGYNSFHELLYCGIPTVFLPQPRLADDQRERVQRAILTGAALEAGGVEEVPALLQRLGTNASEAARAMVPENGAGEAAARVLSLLLPAEEVARAQRVLTAERLVALSSVGLSSGVAMDLLKVFGGIQSSDWKSANDGGDGKGGVTPKAGAALERLLPLFNVTQMRPRRFSPLYSSTFPDVFQPLHPPFYLRKLNSCLPVWSVLGIGWARSRFCGAFPPNVPTCSPKFVSDFLQWLDAYEDLYEAMRTLHRAEGIGGFSLAEVLKGRRAELPDA